MTPPPERPKFDAEFIERRMREHKEWQERVTEALAQEFIDEIEGRTPSRC
jgi:hypothetical protein